MRTWYVYVYVYAGLGEFVCSSSPFPLSYAMQRPTTFCLIPGPRDDFGEIRYRRLMIVLPHFVCSLACPAWPAVIDVASVVAGVCVIEEG